MDGRLAITGLASAGRLLLPDGGLLFFGSTTETGSSDTVMQKFDRNGQPDLAFGPGTGSVTIDLGTALLGAPAARPASPAWSAFHVSTLLELRVRQLVSGPLRPPVSTKTLAWSSAGLVLGLPLGLWLLEFSYALHTATEAIVTYLP